MLFRKKEDIDRKIIKSKSVTFKVTIDDNPVNNCQQI